MSSCKSLTMMAGLGLLVAVSAAGCEKVDPLAVIPEAAVSCPDETVSPEDQAAGANMLPGRVCGACHRAGGQASASPWTLSGTVYATSTTKCNERGLPNVTVEVLYGADGPNLTYRANELQPGGTLRTNEVGNFYSAARYVPPIKIRIYEGDSANPTRQAVMASLVGYDTQTGNTARVDCNYCHFPGSPNISAFNPQNDPYLYGRIYLK